MKLYLWGVSLVVLGVLSIPTPSQAYLTTSQSAVDLGNEMVLFTVSYKFGFLNREVYMPIAAKRNKDFSDVGTDAGYSILFDGKNDAQATTSKISSGVTLNYTVLPGKARAIVLSDAEIKDNRYYLPQGKSATFTLVALVDMSNSEAKEDISLLMTSLPFTMIKDGAPIEARLNPSELQYYKTPEITLK
jgi:hypothetical protein